MILFALTLIGALVVGLLVGAIVGVGVVSAARASRPEEPHTC